MTFSSFITRIYGELFNKNSKTLDALRQITVRQLKELSSHRTHLMEASASFPIRTVSPYGGEYADASVSGFPPDLMEIDLVTYTSGGERIEVRGPVPHRELRLYTPFPALTTAYPEVWSWFDEKLWVAPALAAETTLTIDYFRDATRDEATGAVITETSTNETNPWFDRGELVLRYAVLSEYYMMPGWLDAEKAGACVQMRNRYLDTLKQERALREGSSMQAPPNLGGYR